MLIGTKDFSDRPVLTASQLQQAAAQAQQGACRAASNMSPLGEALQLLEGHLRSLEDQLYILQEKLNPLMFPASPDTGAQGNQTTPPIPLIEAIAQRAEMVARMQRLVEDVTKRLAI